MPASIQVVRHGRLRSGVASLWAWAKAPRLGVMLLSCLVTLAVSPMSYACSPGGLNAPEGYYQAPAKDATVAKPYHCKSLPPYTQSLVFRSKYEGSDKARNVINVQAEQSYHHSIAEIRKLEDLTVSGADDYLVHHDGLAARSCVLDTLDQWASANALLNPDVNLVGQAVRKWALAASANAYLRLTLAQGAPPIDPARKQRILNWFEALATQVRAYYSNRALKRVNNHDYWAGWAVMASAVATGNCDDWNWAVGKYDFGVGQIDAQGYLPNELRRKDRALYYSNFALQPLTMMAVFGKANGLDLYARDNDALARLAKRVLAGVSNPQVFVDRTGDEQVTKHLQTNWSLSWIGPWKANWGTLPGMQPYLDKFSKFAATRLGGDLTWIYHVPDNGKAPLAPKVDKVQ